MSSSPNSQPEITPLQLDDSSVSTSTSTSPPPPPTTTSTNSPPTSNKSNPPPSSNSSPPPPTTSSSPPPPTSSSSSSSPPPTTLSPPPVTPSPPPPASASSSPPPSPQVASASPPPSPTVASISPPLQSSSNPYPPPATFNTFTTPTIASPPPVSRTPASPTVPESTSVSSDYPNLITTEPDIPDSSSAQFVSPPVDPSAPTTTTTSSTSPSDASTNTPTGSSNSSPTKPVKSSNPNSNAEADSTVWSPNTPDNNNDQAVKSGVAIGVVVAAVIIGFMLAVLFVQRRRKKHSQYNSVYVLPSPYNNSSPAASGSSAGAEFLGSPDPAGLGNTKSWFSYEELGTATNGFASQNILGAGGFGCVYKGVLQDGREVAIKKLKDNSGQGDREFKAEVEIISRVHHRYLVALVGYCISDHQRLLAYEFVPNGTLHHHLHSSSKPPMAWTLRVKVACGSARGIAYLHEDCHPRIIHRDIKSENILVDNNFDAKVADFGLAKLAKDLESNTHISTRVMGTFGYMAPEYASSGKLTEKSDVFSFGVVLLEIITGRKPVDETRPLGDESLVEWARPLMTEALENGNFDELSDPRLQGNYDQSEMFRLIEAAAACVRHSAVKRPKMSQVVRSLDTMGEISDLSNGMKPGQSAIYDSREHSAQIRLFQRMGCETEDFSSENYNTQGNWPSGGRNGLL